MATSGESEDEGTGGVAGVLVMVGLAFAGMILLMAGETFLVAGMALSVAGTTLLAAVAGVVAAVVVVLMGVIARRRIARMLAVAGVSMCA